MTTPGRGSPDGADRRRQARSFGATAAEHDRVRPGYPVEVLRRTITAEGTVAVDRSLRCSVADLVALVYTWSYVALSPAREAVRRAAEDLAGPDGTVRLAQTVHAYPLRRA